jgi:hypothetical protein
VSGTLFGAPGVADGILQSKLRHRLPHRGLRTVRPAALKGIADIFNFLFRLGAVQPPHAILGRSRQPAAEQLLFGSVKADTVPPTTASFLKRVPAAVP